LAEQELEMVTDLFNRYWMINSIKPTSKLTVFAK
jgi:hypothetical protein